MVVTENAMRIVNHHVGPLFNRVGLDLVRRDALDKVWAHCLKTCLDIAAVVPVYPHGLSEIALTVVGAVT